MKITKKIYDGMVMTLPKNIKLSVERGELVIDSGIKPEASTLFCFKVSDEPVIGYKVIGHSRFGTKHSKRVSVMVISEAECKTLNTKAKFFHWYGNKLGAGYPTKKEATSEAGFGVAIVDRDAALNLIFQRMVKA